MFFYVFLFENQCFYHLWSLPLRMGQGLPRRGRGMVVLDNPLGLQSLKTERARGPASLAPTGPLEYLCGAIFV